jgi:hypothetical protein
MKADVRKQRVEVKYDKAKTDPQKLADAINKHTTFKASVIRAKT